ncbi:MAG TPA: hypothetical protein VMV10_32680 [Pirellulales bacterium]|nr:hypothetical protein [Pirellulales bacterium]
MALSRLQASLATGGVMDSMPVEMLTMKKIRPKNRVVAGSPNVLQPGQLSLRVAIPAFACFIAFAACSFLNSTFYVRLAGAVFLAATFAILDWHMWKTGSMKTNFGVIIRSEQPMRFCVNAFIFLSVELFMLIGAIVNALRAAN